MVKESTIYEINQQKTLSEVLEGGKIKSQVTLDNPKSSPAQIESAKKFIYKINRVKTHLSSVAIDAFGKKNILNLRMNQLVTGTGVKALGDVLTNSKIMNLKNGPIGEIGERLKNAWNVSHYTQGFLNTKKFLDSKTAMGSYAISNPIKAAAVSTFADIVEGITAQRQVLKWEPDSIKKFTTIMKNLKGDFKMSMGLQLYGGWRPGDLMTGRIENIDWDKGTIRDVTIKAGGKTEAKILVLGKAELAIIKEGIGSRTSGPIFLTKQTAINRVLNNRIANAFKLPIETTKEGITKLTNLTQKYMRKGFVDLMEGAGYTIDQMEIKQGRRAASVIKSYLSVSSNLNKIRILSDDVAKAIAGYSGDTSVGKALARARITTNSIVSAGAHILPVSLKDLPNTEFIKFVKANFEKSWNTISKVPKNAYYNSKGGLTDAKSYIEVNPPSKGLSGGIDENQIYEDMQHQTEINKASREYLKYRKEVATSLGIEEGKMNTSSNRQLIDDELIRLREEMIENQPLKKGKPSKVKPVPTSKKIDENIKIAKELGVDAGTSEGRKSIRAYLKSLMGKPLLKVLPLLPLIEPAMYAHIGRKRKDEILTDYAGAFPAEIPEDYYSDERARELQSKEIDKAMFESYYIDEPEPMLGKQLQFREKQGSYLSPEETDLLREMEKNFEEEKLRKHDINPEDLQT